MNTDKTHICLTADDADFRRFDLTENSSAFIYEIRGFAL
jgi:hypothetical protein